MKLFPARLNHLLQPISVRLAIWYALAATTTLACLFFAGYLLLQSHLINGLDLLNAAEFKQLKSRLGSDYETLNSEVINARIRETTDYASVLFYINVDNPQKGMLFHSTNLNGRSMPDVKGEHSFNIVMDGIGELRVREYLLPPFEVSIGTPLHQVRSVLDGYMIVCLTLLGGMLLVSTGIGYYLSRLALRPVRLISETANHIRSDNLSQRIPVSEVNDEISDLSQMLNQMFDRLELSFNQIRRFSAEASHELKTPLSLIRLYAEKMMFEAGRSTSDQDTILELLDEVARLDRIIEELLFLSRAEANAIPLNLKRMNPAPFLQNFALDAQALAEHHGRYFSHTHDGEGSIAFDDSRLRQVLLNLLTNALNASPPGGRISLHSQLGDGVWRISVEDQGPGLPAEQHERIFERFVRIGPPSGEDKGNGLGLAICRSIVELHRGTIFATSAANDGGLQIVIQIPDADV